MDEKYIFFENVIDGVGVVTGIHFMPNDPVSGLSDNEKSKGILYNGEIPEDANIKGKVGILKININTKELWYEYVDRPLTPEEIQQEQNEKLDLLLQMQMSMQGVI